MQPSRFDTTPFTLSLLNGRVTFTFDGDDTPYGWEGPVASSEDGPDQPTVCRIAFSSPNGDVPQGIAITDEVEAKLEQFFTANGLDWASNKAAIDAIRAQKTVVISSDAAATSIPDAPAASTIEDLPASAQPHAVAQPSPVTPGTHVEVHKESVSWFHGAFDVAERALETVGSDGAKVIHAIIDEFRRVFPRAA